MSWLYALFALPASAAVCRLLATGRWSRLVTDVPNERSLHRTVVPRTGGLGILLGAGIGLATVHWISAPFPIELLGIGAAGGLLAGASFLDDVRGLPVGTRLIVHAGAAAIGLAAMGQLDWQFSSMAALLAIVWMTNLYNFMDGADGLAGGMALFGFTAYALASWWGGVPTLALACLALAAAAAGFLTQNFPPARIFMGDAGSTTLGLLAALLGLYGVRRDLWPLWFPVLVFSPFIIDASVTLIRRALRGEKIWRAHNQHYYQRLIRSGWTHLSAARACYALMFATGCSALFGLSAPDWVPGLLVGWAVMFTLIMLKIDRYWATHSPTP